MSVNDIPPPRYESRAAIDLVSDLLQFPKGSTNTQDWELMLTDPARLTEFCDLYEGGHLEGETRFALMRLMIASLDDLLERNPEAGSDEPVERMERLLRQDFTLHLHTINYWCLHEEADPENVFAVTPLLRRIWSECYNQERHQHWLRESEP